MDAAEPPGSPERGRRQRRSQIFSLRFSLRSLSKRTSVLDNLQEQPKCVERIHYPVFDPEDPRHASSLDGRTRRRHESQTSSSESQNLAQRIHDLPLRSLHRARSGLMALRAGILRRSDHRSTNQPDGPSSPRLMGELEQGHAYARAPPSEASTQEDPSFGYELSRETEVSTQEDPSFGYELSRETENWDSSPENHGPGSMMTVSLVHTLDSAIASAVPADPNPHQYHLESTVLDTVGDSCNQSFVSKSSETSVTNSRHLGGLGGTSETEQLVPDTGSISGIDLTESASSEWRSDLFCLAKSVDEPRGPCNMEGEDAVSVDSEYPRGLSLENLGSGIGVENAQSVKCEQETTDCSVGSFTFPDPDALSTLSSNASGGRRFKVAQSEAFATQEQIQLPRSSSGFEDVVQSGERPRQCSAVIQFAFPGVYQALVDQWVEQGCDSAQMPTSEGTMTANAALDAEKKTSDQTSPAAHLTSVPNITSQHQCHAHPGTTVVFSCGQPALNEATVLQSPRDFSVGIGGHYGGSDLEQAPSVPMQAPERRHSFGLHISLRNANDGGDQFNEPSPQQYTGEDHYSSSSVGLGGVLGSLCDESDFSANYTPEGTTSAEVTSPTSVSGSVWSPLDSPIDEEVYFSGSFRDEYYMGDGKTSSHHPDRDDLPVKAARRALADGSIYSGFGLDRAPSYRTREMAEMRPQGTIRPAQPVRRAVMQSEESESAEDSTLVHQSQPGHLH